MLNEYNYSKVILSILKNFWNKCYFPNLINSVIVGGSLSRNEFFIDDGEILSDIDLTIVIYQKNALLSYLLERQIRSRLRRILRRYKIDVEINVGVISFEHLVAQVPTFLSYDLRKYGTVIFGDVEIKKFIPPNSVLEIPLWEGLRKVFNMVLHLVQAILTHNQRKIKYSLANLYIAIGDALLFLHGEYDPMLCEKLKISYKNREILSNFYKAYINALKYRLYKVDCLTGYLHEHINVVLQSIFKITSKYAKYLAGAEIREDLLERIRAILRFILEENETLHYFIVSDFIRNNIPIISTWKRGLNLLKRYESNKLNKLWVSEAERVVKAWRHAPQIYILRPTLKEVLS